MPEPDGTVGSIEVASKGGTQLLSKPGYVVIAEGSTSPSAPVPMEESKIQATFKEAIAIQPSLPQHYMLYFFTDSTKLTLEATAMVPEILKDINSRKFTDVAIIGHTDRVGSRKYNFKLSVDRAMVVKKILIKAGVADSGIEISSHGENNPLIPTADNVPEPRNRRVEIVVR